MIRAFQPGDERHAEAILRALPRWFGIEESLVQYVRDTGSMETWFAQLDGEPQPAGFITIHTHFPSASEVHCIGVTPEHHRAGIGRALIHHAERVLAPRAVRFLQVKTLGPSKPSAEYELTRRFYEGMGFTALEEFKTLWPGNPALQLVKAIG